MGYELMEEKSKDHFIVSEIENFRGLPEVDADKCTACGICSIHCPTKAIEIAMTVKDLVHRIYSGKCIACGKCQEVCPEEAIHLSRKMGQVEGLRSMLVVEKIINVVRCKVCGKPIASKLQVEKIKENLKKSDHDVEDVSSISVCRECRILLTKRTSDKIIR